MHRGDCVNKHHFGFSQRVSQNWLSKCQQNGCGVQEDREKNNYNKRNQKFQAEKRRMDGKIFKRQWLKINVTSVAESIGFCHFLQLVSILFIKRNSATLLTMVDNQEEWIFEGREKMRSRKIDRGRKRGTCRVYLGWFKGISARRRRNFFRGIFVKLIQYPPLGWGGGVEHLGFFDLDPAKFTFFWSYVYR